MFKSVIIKQTMKSKSKQKKNRKIVLSWDSNNVGNEHFEAPIIFYPPRPETRGQGPEDALITSHNDDGPSAWQQDLLSRDFDDAHFLSVALPRAVSSHPSSIASWPDVTNGGSLRQSNGAKLQMISFDEVIRGNISWVVGKWPFWLIGAFVCFKKI